MGSGMARTDRPAGPASRRPRLAGMADCGWAARRGRTVGSGRRGWPGRRLGLRRGGPATRRGRGGGRVPEARSGGYEVLGVSADAASFDAAVARARQATAGAERAAGLAEALSLVRGAPFSAVPRRSYGWADAGPLASSLANTIHRVALDLAALARSDGHPDLADWALAQGLAVWPTDETFLELRLAVAYDRGGVSELERQWAATTTALARLDAEPSPKLVDTHQLLIDRDRHRGPSRHPGLGG